MVGDDVSFLTSLAERFKSYFGKEKSLKKKFDEVWMQWNPGKIDEEGLVERAEEMDIEVQKLVEFIYYKEMAMGSSGLRSFDQVVDKEDPTHDSPTSKKYHHPDFFLKGAFPGYPEALMEDLQRIEKRFKTAEKLAEDFELRQKEISLTKKQYQRIERRREIVENMLQVVEEVESPELEHMREIMIDNFEGLQWERDKEAIKEAPNIGFGSSFPLDVEPKKLSENEHNEYLIEEIRELHGKMAERVGQDNIETLETLYEELNSIAENKKAVRRDIKTLKDLKI